MDILVSPTESTSQPIEEAKYISPSVPFNDDPLTAEAAHFEPIVLKTPPFPARHLLFLHNEVHNLDAFLRSNREDTFPIVYSAYSNLPDLSDPVFDNIDRVGFVFDDSQLETKRFLHGWSFFDDEAVDYLVGLFRDKRVRQVDFLACFLGLSDKWKTLHETLASRAEVVLGASIDETGNAVAGGDWVMETTMEDVEKVYFTEEISNYSSTLTTSSITTDTTLSGSNFGSYTWPVSVDAGVAITIEGMINVSNISQHLILKASNTTVAGVNNATLNFTGFTSANPYGGFIRSDPGLTNLIIENITTTTTASSVALATNAGWLLRNEFGRSGSNITIRNCSNSGSVNGQSSGGIAGANFAIEATGMVQVINCSNTGTINGSGSGGILGEFAGNALAPTGTIVITNCTNRGNITTNGRGGIAGRSLGQNAAGQIQILHCTNAGTVGANDSGGIVGNLLGILLRSTGLVAITNCTNSRTINNSNAGGITGSNSGQEAEGSVRMENCTNTGLIQGVSAGGITGAFTGLRSKRTGLVLITNCINSGTINDLSAGGITGSNSGQEAEGSVRVENCTNTGLIQNLFAGGISGSRTGYLSKRTGLVAITNCTNSGTIGSSSSSAGGITGSRSGDEAEGSVRVENCANTGLIQGGSAGGITGGFTGNRSKGTGLVLITNCTNSGSITTSNAGGITGSQCGQEAIGFITIQGCYNLGNLSSSASESGGICGSTIGQNSQAASRISIQQCYSQGTLSVPTNQGGLIGGQSSSYTGAANITVSNCYTLVGFLVSPSRTSTLTINITNSYTANNAWSDTAANAVLLGTPTPTNPVGSSWVSISSDTPYLLASMTASYLAIPRTATLPYTTPPGPLSGGTYSLLSVNGTAVIPFSITINTTTGAVTFQPDTPSGTYSVMVYYQGSYYFLSFAITFNPVIKVEGMFTPARYEALRLWQQCRKQNRPKKSNT